ncbi:MAG: DegV family protein [Actinomycetota bacterium]
MTVAVVTDSAIAWPATIVSDRTVTVVPLGVSVGRRDYLDGVTISGAEVARALRSDHVVLTSRPSPQTFLQAYQNLAAVGATAVVSVHLSAALSGTHSSAVLASGSAPIPVEVVDSTSLGWGMGWLVHEAARAATRGMDALTIARILRQRASGSVGFFAVGSLKHLRRGGRLKSAAASVGSALSGVAVLRLCEGVIQPIDHAQTVHRAVDRLAQFATQVIAESAMIGVEHEADATAQTGSHDLSPSFQAVVHHLDGAHEGSMAARQLADRIKQQWGQPVPIVPVGAVIGAHAGPDAVAVIVTPR